MTKLVFLDIDDTINDFGAFNTFCEHGMDKYRAIQIIEGLKNPPLKDKDENGLYDAVMRSHNPYITRMLYALCELTGAKIVWQTAWGMEDIEKFLFPVTGLGEHTHEEYPYACSKLTGINKFDGNTRLKQNICIADKLNCNHWVYFDNMVEDIPIETRPSNCFSEVTRKNIEKCFKFLDCNPKM